MLGIAWFSTGIYKEKRSKKEKRVELLESCCAPFNNPTFFLLRKQSPAYINSKIELFWISSLFKDTANYELCSRGSLSEPGEGSLSAPGGTDNRISNMGKIGAAPIPVGEKVQHGKEKGS